MTSEEKIRIADSYVTMARKNDPRYGGGNWFSGKSQRVGCTFDADGNPTIYREYYRDEGMDDEDLSATGYFLRYLPGYTRVRSRWTREQFGNIDATAASMLQQCLPQYASR